MVKILNQSLIQKLKKAFSQQKEVLAVYVFGSRLVDMAYPQSDLDIAVLVSNRKKLSERELLRFLKEKEINIPFSLDLSCVDLESPPLFLFQIIKNGICLYEKNSFQKTNLESFILRLYYDNQHLRNIYRHYLQKSLKEGTYGY